MRKAQTQNPLLLENVARSLNIVHGGSGKTVSIRNQSLRVIAHRLCLRSLLIGRWLVWSLRPFPFYAISSFHSSSIIIIRVRISSTRADE